MSISNIDPAQLGPNTKAAVLYAQARSELSGRLWQAALGADDTDDAGAPERGNPDLGFDTLVALLAGDAAGVPRPPIAQPYAAATTSPAVIRPDQRTAPYAPPILGDDGSSGGKSRALGALGSNAGYTQAISVAAVRTGIPAPALAAIVNAEAAKDADGRWQTYSRNPRSSAAGLGQFLSGTWVGEAERAGTWLHNVAAGKGWLDGSGKVTSEARSALLALRYDGGTAIQAAADYAKANLTHLRAAGIQIGDSVESIAQSAYVGHHLGLGDAIRFLSTGLDPARARILLRAQIGTSAADERIAEAGSATRAHRDWLLGYVARRIQPDRFAASFAPAAGNNYRNNSATS
jgi:hypothetical protein